MDIFTQAQQYLQQFQTLQQTLQQQVTQQTPPPVADNSKSNNIGDEFKKIPGRFTDVMSGLTLSLAEYVPTKADMEGCPPNSYPAWNGNCMGNEVNREDGVNWSETLLSHSDKSDGCSWNRHIEYAVGVPLCYRACPSGYVGRAPAACFANGSDIFGVMRYVTDRKLSCPSDRNLIAGLCYKK